jgi:hypothetical protein
MLAFVAAGLLPLGLSGQQQPILPAPVKKIIEFRADIAPILARCVGCHGPANQSSGLRLDNGTDAMRGGVSGPVIHPGESAKSRLIHLVAGVEPNRAMPLGSAPLSGLDVSLLRAWIDQGAEWDGEVLIEAPGASQRPAQKHWAGTRDAVELGRVSLDQDTLKQIAENGGGVYFHESSAEQILEHLRPLSNGMIVESDILVWQSFYWFWAIILLLAIEWWMRKRAGLV